MRFEFKSGNIPHLSLVGAIRVKLRLMFGGSPSKKMNGRSRKSRCELKHYLHIKI